jgi:hypothetical protein
MLLSQVSRISLTLNNKGRGLAQNTGKSTELLRNKNVDWLTVDTLNRIQEMAYQLPGNPGLKGTYESELPV